MSFPIATAPTKPTAGDWWRLARPCLAEDLLPDDQAQKLQDLTDQLPGSLECALDLPLGDEFDEPAPARLELRVSSPQWAGALPDLLPNPQSALLRGWVDGKIPVRAISAFSYSLPLVADLETAMQSAVPSIELERAAPPQWSMDSFLPLFHQREFTEQQKFFLMQLVQQLPPTEKPFHITSLGEQGLRLRTFDWPARGVLPFLEAVSLEELTSDVSSLVPLWADTEQRVLALEFINDGLLPRLQMECSFTRRPDGEPRWRELMDELVERDLAAPEAAEAVLDWPGTNTPSALGDRWPGPADEAGALGREIDRIQWRLSSQAAPEARAILSIRRQEGSPP